MSIVKHKLSTFQRGSIYYSRSFYLLTYLSFFKEGEFDHIPLSDVINDIMLDIGVLPSFPDGFTAQVFTKVLKKLHSDPKSYVEKLIAKIFTMPMNYFAFCSFPSLFGFFTTAQLTKCAGDFILELIRRERTGKVLFNFVLSFMLSSFSFIDAFWLSLHRKIGQKSHMKIEEANHEMAETIKNCMPLISEPVYKAIRELTRKNKRIAIDVIYNFLAVTFKIWYNQSGEGLTFACGDVIRNALLMNNDINILRSFLYRKKGQISTIPEYFRSCGFRNIFLCFSSIDFVYFSKCFVDNKLFLSNDYFSNTENRFWPYIIDYYPSIKVEKSKIESPLFYDYVSEIFAFTNQNKIAQDGTEQIITNKNHNKAHGNQLNVKVTSSKEKENNSSIEKSNFLNIFKSEVETNADNVISKIMKAEKIIELQRNLLTAENIHSSLSRIRNNAFSYSISCFIKNKHFCSFDRIFHECSTITNMALFTRSLFEPLYQCCLNNLDLPKHITPPDIKLMFSTFQEEMNNKDWMKVHNYKGNKFAFEIASFLNRRKIESLGDSFKMLNYIFHLISVTDDYFCDSAYTWVDIMNFVIKVSHYDFLLETFLIFEKIIFTKEEVTKRFKEKEVDNWKLFFQTMWSGIITNDEMFHKILKFDPLQKIEQQYYS
ncbi:hypothetical protein TRFO_31195 [Tritrichomonas foetus]|uniref:Uncharacterized protein n=1 Tax=Tritrichomonas foetus TaxID=1144522 RepID=A0A1J4JX96_9EUKA|nr:hypothetical protein TRFO_31195 [Tritrichomonas foetus]|eukprot:OHT01901.1 hypothetical protein TRFO_31195 [Tritrichomonas foetus]